MRKKIHDFVVTGIKRTNLKSMEKQQLHEVAKILAQMWTLFIQQVKLVHVLALIN